VPKGLKQGTDKTKHKALGIFTELCL